jgi:hypothetical protein
VCITSECMRHMLRDMPVFGTSRPQNPPSLIIVLQWFWGYTCSNTQTLTEQTTPIPAYSLQTPATSTLHRMRCGLHYTCISLRTTWTALQQLSGSVRWFRTSISPISCWILINCSRLHTGISLLTRHMRVWMRVCVPARTSLFIHSFIP